MKKRKNARLKRKNEFRYHNVIVHSRNGRTRKIKHPSYIFLEKGNIYIFVTITHSSKINDLKIIKLNKNPNPKDKRDSYVVLVIQTDIKSSFGVRHANWKIDVRDEELIREFYNTEKDKK